ncbi:MAG: hypothetical protein JSW41_05570 [Candidatus Aenigmatarchaeota archaeon]|nr:MAG: hypothetical protein JSW41_05570 [Candidatus Aenigmarchaeota archaeon]
MAYPTLKRRANLYWTKVSDKAKEKAVAISSISLFVVMSIFMVWLYVSGENVLGPQYFRQDKLLVHIIGLLMFMMLYVIWVLFPRKHKNRRIRYKKAREIMEIPLFKAIPGVFLGSLVGTVAGWMLFNVLYGVPEVVFSWQESVYLFIYFFGIVSVGETIMFVKIMYDIGSGTEDKDVVSGKKFSTRGGIISATSFTAFHLGVIQVWNLNALAWVWLWGFIFVRFSKPIFIKWKGKTRQVPWLGIGFVLGLHAFLDIMMVVYPLSFMGG